MHRSACQFDWVVSIVCWNPSNLAYFALGNEKRHSILYISLNSFALSLDIMVHLVIRHKDESKNGKENALLGSLLLTPVQKLNKKPNSDTTKCIKHFIRKVSAVRILGIFFKNLTWRNIDIKLNILPHVLWLHQACWSKQTDHLCSSHLPNQVFINCELNIYFGQQKLLYLTKAGPYLTLQNWYLNI